MRVCSTRTRSVARTGRWSEPTSGEHLAVHAPRSVAARTRMWSIWLWGRLRRPGAAAHRAPPARAGTCARRGPRSCSRRRRSPGRPGGRELRGEPAELDRRAVREARREVDADEVDRRCRRRRARRGAPPRSGVGSPGTVPDRRARHARSAGSRLSTARPDRRRAPLPSRGTCGHGSSVARPNGSSNTSAPSVAGDASTAAAPPSGAPRLLHHDHVGVEARAAPRRGRRARTRRCGAAAGRRAQLKLTSVSSGIGGRRVLASGRGEAHRAGGRRRAARRRSSTVPPCCSTIAFTIESPSPRPPASRARPSSSRVKRSNTRSRSSAGMPGPSSSTVSSTVLGRRRRELDRDRASSRGGPRCRQVAHDAGELLAAAVHAAGRHPGGVDGHAVAGCTVSSSTSSSRSTSGSDVDRRAVRRSRRGGRARAARSPCPPCARPRRARARRPRASRRGRRCAARPRGCVRIDASGLRSSCDASDTNWRWRCDDSLEPVEHRVHRAGEAADLVVGVGLGHPAVDGGPVIASASTRIASTGRSARPGEVPRRERDERDRARAPRQQHGASPSCRPCGRPRRATAARRA